MGKLTVWAKSSEFKLQLIELCFKKTWDTQAYEKQFPIEQYLTQRWNHVGKYWIANMCDNLDDNKCQIKFQCKINICYLTVMFIAAVFTIHKIRKQLKCPPRDEWKRWYTDTHTHTCVHVCLYVFVCIYDICTYVYICIYMLLVCIYMYVYMCVWIYTHTMEHF